MWQNNIGKILLGLLPQTTGSVDLCGQPITDVPRLELARTIQPIFQDPFLFEPAKDDWVNHRFADACATY